MNKHKQTGVTLVEMMVAVGLIGIVTYFIMGLQENMSKTTSYQRGHAAIEKVLRMNAFALKSQDAVNFPEYGSCLLRRYSFEGEMIDEKQSNDCNSPKMGENVINVYVHYRNYEDITANFSTESLKLPQYDQNLYQIDLTGTLNFSRRDIVKKLSIFRK